MPGLTQSKVLQMPSVMPAQVNCGTSQGLLETFAATNQPYWLTKWVHKYFTGHSQSSNSSATLVGILMAFPLLTILYRERE